MKAIFDLFSSKASRAFAAVGSRNESELEKLLNEGVASGLHSQCRQSAGKEVSLLSFAISLRFVRAVELLLRRGAKVEAPEMQAAIDMVSSSGPSPEEMAESMAPWQIMRAITLANADWHAQPLPPHTLSYRDLMDQALFRYGLSLDPLLALRNGQYLTHRTLSSHNAPCGPASRL